MQDIGMITENDLKVGNWIYLNMLQSNYLMLLKILEYVETSPYYNQSHTVDASAVRCLIIEVSKNLPDRQFFLNKSDSWDTYYEIRKRKNEKFLFQPDTDDLLDFKDLKEGYPLQDDNAKLFIFDALFSDEKKLIRY